MNNRCGNSTGSGVDDVTGMWKQHFETLYNKSVDSKYQSIISCRPNVPAQMVFTWKPFVMGGRRLRTLLCISALRSDEVL